MPLLSDGQLIRGTYEVERFLGEGAFAEVYHASAPFSWPSGDEGFQAQRNDST